MLARKRICGKLKRLKDAVGKNIEDKTNAGLLLNKSADSPLTECMPAQSSLEFCQQDGLSNKVEEGNETFLLFKEEPIVLTDNRKHIFRRFGPAILSGFGKMSQGCFLKKTFKKWDACDCCMVMSSCDVLKKRKVLEHAELPLEGKLCALCRSASRSKGTVCR